MILRLCDEDIVITHPAELPGVSAEQLQRFNGMSASSMLHPGMVLTKGRATRRDRGRHTGKVAGHHIGITLDDHRLRTFRDFSACQVDTVENLALVIDRRLGRIEVFCLDPVVVEESPRTESDDVTVQFPDRPEQPPSKPVVSAAGAFGHQATADQATRDRPAASTGRHSASAIDPA